MPLSPSAQPDLAWLTEQDFAHRGLHVGKGMTGPVMENSRAAFRAAIAAGHGIECDVQPAADGTAMVFHDARLERLTETSGCIADKDAAALGRIRLKTSEETIPRLTDMLALIDGRVPLLIEIKADGGPMEALCASVHRAVDDYLGDAAIMSFSPRAVAWFRHNAPNIPRGLVITEERDRTPVGTVQRRLAVWHARPDFLAYDVRDLPSAFAARQRRKGLPVLSWTVRTPGQWRIVETHADAAIYERSPAA